MTEKYHAVLVKFEASICENLRIDCFNNVELGKGGRCPSLLMKYNWANTFGQQIKTLAIFETNQDFCKNVSWTLLLYNKFSVTFDKGNPGEKNIDLQS